MLCWVNGEKCVHGLTNPFCQNDLLKETCGKCVNFSEKDLEKNFRALGFAPMDHSLPFSEDELDVLEDHKELLNVILITQVNEVHEHLIQVREIRKSILREKHPNSSEKGLEEMVKLDHLFCNMEDCFEALELLTEVFE